jgi:hypothetical protein
MMLFAVFAVLAGNYQPSKSRYRRKSWAGEGSANQRTAKRALFWHQSQSRQAALC